ncbi:unnamed protein product [Moneuplotes crassus]|uniref:Uncharacterized protein n=1 Tax=Euplotes crassus TaxID=5936 RepID=A0AAD2DCC5_EUPCR|nr:unnamed protein product [Moneuplotes crassus]
MSILEFCKFENLKRFGGLKGQICREEVLAQSRNECEVSSFLWLHKGFIFSSLFSMKLLNRANAVLDHLQGKIQQDITVNTGVKEKDLGIKIRKRRYMVINNY